jgi:hypothetical protein
MINIDTLEQEIKELKRKKDELWQEERKLKGQLFNLEREQFNGLTYGEYINTLNEKIKYNDNITITINTYNIDANYNLGEDIIMQLHTTIYAFQDTYSTSILYPTKAVNKTPKKYEAQEKELKEICFKYKIENKAENLRKQYELSAY